MKKIFLFAACAATLASCSDDKQNGFTPVDPGTEVSFAVDLGSQSRTIYGDEVNNAFPISWVDGDLVQIVSPQCAAGRNSATYKVGNVTDNYAETVEKVGEVGIQWGDNETSNFYSIYPTAYNTSSTTEVKNTLTPSGESAVAKLNVRNYQINVFENVDGEWKGTPIDRKTMTSLDANLKNPDALMYAQKKHTGGGNVILGYKPFTTAFHVTLDGYVLGTQLGTDEGVTIEEVTITAPTGTQLVGNFEATFNADCSSMPTVNTAVNTLAEPNVIHIPTMSSVDGHYLTIKQKEKVSFNVFAIPTGGTVNYEWTLAVRTTSGTFTRPLNATATATSGNLIAGQMHKLNMPTFTVNNSFQFNRESWIAQIPRNVYLSELSLPGAWYCYSTDYQATNNLTTQWNAGVRAFHIDCRLTRLAFENIKGTRGASTLVCAGSESGTTVNKGGVKGTTVLSQLQAVANQVKDDEYAVCVLTIAEKEYTATVSYGTVDQTQVLSAIAGILNTTNIHNLYTKEITSTTTVNDVLGSLIVKINTTSAGPYTGTVPSTLMSMASLASDAVFNKMQSSQMYWGNATAANDLTFYYMQGQRTYTEGSGNPQMTARQTAIESIIDQSQDVYNNSAHNAWFQMGIGGYVKNGNESENRVLVASTLNNYLLQRVNSKINGTTVDNVKYTPSPVGIVLANFITAQTQGSLQVYGTDLTEAIIKMNRMFRLDRDPDQDEWPGQAQADTPANYSAVYNFDGTPAIR